jgi:hypothetical protein
MQNFKKERGIFWHDKTCKSCSNLAKDLILG